MDPLRAQLGNYLEWLENRGLTGPMAFRGPISAPTEPGSESSAVRPEAPSDEPRPAMLSAAELAPTPSISSPVSANPTAAAAGQQHETPSSWKVGFYSSSDLTEEEFLMVSKIALALGLPAEDCKIWAEDSLVHVPVDLLRCSYIIALGPGSGQTLLALGQTVAMNAIQKALQGSPLLTIPHPRAMLREPALKGSAWSALQKFKGLMIH